MDGKMIELINADCMDIMAKYPDKYFDIAIVDPPYGINIGSSPRIHDKNNLEKKEWDLLPPSKEYFQELFRVSKNQIIWGGNYFDLPPTKCFLIWDKKQPEKLSFASAELAWASFNKVVKTFYYQPQTTIQRIHPTQKPVALYKWLLDNYAKSGDLILDTHAGSFSSAVACKEKGFSGVFVELDKDYFRDGKARVDKVSRQYEIMETIKPEIKDQALF